MEVSQLRVFVDTWEWVSLFNQREAHHEAVADYYHSERRRDAFLVTTDYVLDETLTLLCKRLPARVALEKYGAIEQARDDGTLTVEWIDRDRFEDTLALRRRDDDKPTVSFTDLSSMVVMQERGIRDVITGDAHFNHVGLGFRRRPIVS